MEPFGIRFLQNLNSFLLEWSLLKWPLLAQSLGHLVNRPLMLLDTV